MPGPPPSPNRRRRNPPATAGRVLPAAGRAGRAPSVPRPYKLGPAGRAWWRWAWRLPQAEAWDAGTLYVVARRAQLEDHLHAVRFRDELDLDDLLAGADSEAIKRVNWALEMLKRSASGSTSLMKEQRELDDRLGLTPKSMVTMRWTIGPPTDAEAEPPADVASIDAYRARLG